MTIHQVAVVLNGNAEALLQRSGTQSELRSLLAEAGFQAEFISDEGSLPARVARARAVRSGADAVIVAGGDGTIACAAQELAGGQIPLGILPFGTMNLLARDLNLPIGDIAAGIRIIAEGRVRRIDVGEVNSRNDGNLVVEWAIVADEVLVHFGQICGKFVGSQVGDVNHGVASGDGRSLTDWVLNAVDAAFSLGRGRPAPTAWIGAGRHRICAWRASK
jgi:hypothetical protein